MFYFICGFILSILSEKSEKRVKKVTIWLILTIWLIFERMYRNGYTSHMYVVPMKIKEIVSRLPTAREKVSSAIRHINFPFFQNFVFWNSAMKSLHRGKSRDENSTNGISDRTLKYFFLMMSINPPEKKKLTL